MPDFASTDDNSDANHPGWSFWVIWVAATTVGWIVGTWTWAAVARVMNIAMMMVGIVPMEYLGQPWPITMAIPVGVAQALAVRRRLRPPWRWALTSTVGGLLGTATAALWWRFMSEIIVPVPIYAAALGTVTGITVGVAQWLTLRRHVSRAGWWIPTNILGWWLGLYFRWGVIGLGALAGAPYFFISGGVLVWLLQQPAPGKGELGQQ